MLALLTLLFLALGFSLVNGSISGPAPLRVTLSHLPLSWRNSPIVLSIKTEALDGWHWSEKFSSNSDPVANIDLWPLLHDDQYLQVELSMAKGFSCAGCEPDLYTVRIPTQRLRQSDTFYFEDQSQRILLGENYHPTQITFSHPEENIRLCSRFSKRVVILTRGSRGDVQPFLTLALYLAQQHNYHITICAESGFQTFIEKHSNIPRGRIDFVSSGGDTAAAIANPVQLAILSHPSDLIQALAMSLSEVYHFGSEPVMYDLVRRIQPDVILYSQVLISIAALISESLHVPAIGFLLQTASVPATEFKAIVPLPGSNRVMSPELIRCLRSFFTRDELNRIRRRRGLKPHQADSYDYVLAQSVSPIIVPISRYAFGELPHGWPSSIIMSGFVYLPEPVLSSELLQFLDLDLPGPIISISLYSTPVNLNSLRRTVATIATKTIKKPRIVLIGGDDSTTDDVELAQLIRDHRLIHVKSAPFGKLFARVDAAIIHGGLGTTSEVMRAGIPVIVTGMLLMDQRFWGERLYQLGFGPPMIPFVQFSQDPVTIMNQFFDQYASYRANAIAASKVLQVETRDGMGSGPAIVNAIETARPMEFIGDCPRPIPIPAVDWLKYWFLLGTKIVSAMPVACQNVFLEFPKWIADHRTARVELRYVVWDGPCNPSIVSYS